MLIGTFSDEGPTQCSGLPVTQYFIEKLTEVFKPYFQKIKCLQIDHITPGGANRFLQEPAFQTKQQSTLCIKEI
jgi:hypothetical protein